MPRHFELLNQFSSSFILYKIFFWYIMARSALKLVQNILSLYFLNTYCIMRSLAWKLVQNVQINTEDNFFYIMTISARKLVQNVLLILLITYLVHYDKFCSKIGSECLDKYCLVYYDKSARKLVQNVLLLILRKQFSFHLHSMRISARKLVQTTTSFLYLLSKYLVYDKFCLKTGSECLNKC